MTTYSKLNIVYRLQKWMDSVPGQTFLNYAYSWGASIVILGTLFKLTHLPGANLMLYIGMGTEVVVFFLSAFDRPFDKTAIGRELPTHFSDDETMSADTEPVVAGVQKSLFQGAKEPISQGERAYFGTQKSPFGNPTEALSQTGEAPSQANAAPPQGVTAAVGSAEGLTKAQEQYVEELKKLTETLQKVSEQSQKLTRDSEEMETLNRTLTGICRVYEMQLKGASQQIVTIDQINEQSKRMASLIEQLNSVYARMIEAMTVNMRPTAQGGATTM